MRAALRSGAAALVAAAVLLPALPAAATPGPADAPEWWFDSWRVQALWDGGARGQGVTIAEIDTGVNARLPELSANVLPGTDFGPDGGDGWTDHEVDSFGHGTAMASIMVAHPGLLGITGLAPDAKVLPIAVPINGTDDAPTGGDDKIPSAIRWAVDHGGKIISMSLGGRRDPTQDAVPCPDAEQAAVTYAISKGAVVVAASGNSGQNGSPVEDPGVCLGVVSVGAVDRNNQVADFSSRHPYLTVTAPGVNIPSLGRVPGTAFSGSGTSQATAITAATLALVWSKYPSLTGRQVVARLLATLDHRSAGRDPAYGYGIVDAGQAVTATVAPDAPNPVFDGVAPFVERQQALASTPAVPTPAPASTGAPGQFAIDSPPSAVTTRVVVGVGVAAAGAAVLLVLVVAAGVRRRRSAAAALPAPMPYPPPGPPPPGGVVWHDVTGPVWPYPPAPPTDRPPG